MNEDALELGVKAGHNERHLTTDEVVADYHAFCEQVRVNKAARELETQRAAEAHRFEMENTDFMALAAEEVLGPSLAPGGGMRIEKNVRVSGLQAGGNGLMDLLDEGTYDLLFQVRQDQTERVVAACLVPKDGSERPKIDALLRSVDRKRRAPDDNTRE